MKNNMINLKKQVMSEKNDKLTTDVKSKLDFTITKDDILLVLLSDKEEELKKELEVAEINFKLKNVEIDGFKLQLEEFIRKDLSLKKSDKFDFLTYDYNSKELFEVPMYDVERIQNLKNPALARNKKYIMRSNPYKLHKTLIVTREYSNKEGFKGELVKKFEMELSKYKNLLDQLNGLFKQSLLLQSEVSHCEYKLLILDTDKSVKSNLIKKIVNTSEYSQLFLETGDK